MTEIQIKNVLCKHCNNEYSSTKEFFYTCNGKLKLDICKDCKKKRSKENEKNRKNKDRRKSYNAYNLKRKLAKQALPGKDI
jgi:hypothetical protein